MTLTHPYPFDLAILLRPDEHNGLAYFEEHQRRDNYEDSDPSDILHSNGCLLAAEDDSYQQSSLSDRPPSQLSSILRRRTIGGSPPAILAAGDAGVLGLPAVSERVDMVRSSRMGRNVGVHAG